MIETTFDRDQRRSTASDTLAEWLDQRGISIVYTLPGGMIATALDAIHRRGATRLVTMHHEQAAAFAADGASRYSGRPAVALATAGPGATNMLTPIASAYLDSVPALFIVGQVQTYLLKGERTVRQFGFQECDVLAMARPVTKGAFRVSRAADLAPVLDEAYDLAIEGRPGPVIVELPADVQAASQQVSAAEAPVSTRPRHPADPVPSTEPGIAGFLDDLRLAAKTCERPLVLLGGGVHAARATRSVQALTRRLAIPVVASVTALDVLDVHDPLRVGMIGMYGNRWANQALHEADLVLVLGSKLDFGTIGADGAAFARGKKIFQVDVDEAETHRVHTARTVRVDLEQFCAEAAQLEWEPAQRWQTWQTALADNRRAWPDTGELTTAGINPNQAVADLSDASSGAAAFVVDAGQHLWWACQSYRPQPGQRFLPALGLGPCGWALPAAIGVCVSSGQPTVMLAGDGSFQFNLQELQTVVREQLPLKLVIFDNENHGSVRQLQEQAFDGRYPTTVWGYSTPDFTALARTYGIKATTVDDPERYAAALQWLWDTPAEPALLRVKLDPALNVYPNIAFGAPLNQMQRAPQPAHLSRQDRS